MASIAKRSDGVWRARYRDAGGREHSKHFGRKVDAQRWLDEQTTGLVTGQWLDPAKSRVTVGDWSGRWLAAQGQLKPSTRARYEGLLRVQVLPSWGAVPFGGRDARRHRVVGHVSLAPATVRQAHRVLSLVLGLAVRDGRLHRNPADKVPLPRASRPEKRFLSHTEVARLAESAGGYGLAIQVLAYTGLRFGELAALKVRRVDLMRRRLEVAESVTEVAGRAVWGTPKTHATRSVPVPRSLTSDLALQVAGKGPDDVVFASPDGQPLRLSNFRRRCSIRRLAAPILPV